MMTALHPFPSAFILMCCLDISPHFDILASAVTGLGLTNIQVLVGLTEIPPPQQQSPSISPFYPYDSDGAER